MAYNKYMKLYIYQKKKKYMKQYILCASLTCHVLHCLNIVMSIPCACVRIHVSMFVLLSLVPILMKSEL